METDLVLSPFQEIPDREGTGITALQRSAFIRQDGVREGMSEEIWDVIRGQGDWPLQRSAFMMQHRVREGMGHGMGHGRGQGMGHEPG